AIEHHRRHHGGLTFIDSDHDTDGVLLGILLDAVHTHSAFEKTAIKIKFFKSEEISIECRRIIRFPTFPWGKQWALCRGHELAKRATTEMGVPRKSKLAYLWKRLQALRFRHFRLLRGTSSTQKGIRENQHNTTALERAQTTYGSRETL